MVTKILQLITIRTKILILLQGFGKSKINKLTKKYLKIKTVHSRAITCLFKIDLKIKTMHSCNNVSVQDLLENKDSALRAMACPFKIDLSESRSQ